MLPIFCPSSITPDFNPLPGAHAIAMLPHPQWRDRDTVAMVHMGRLPVFRPIGAAMTRVSSHKKSIRWSCPPLAPSLPEAVLLTQCILLPLQQPPSWSSRPRLISFHLALPAHYGTVDPGHNAFPGHWGWMESIKNKWKAAPVLSSIWS